MSRESCCSTRLAFSLSVLRSLLMGAQITHPQLELGNQQDSFESTSLSCFSPSFSLFLLSNCELDYESLYCLLAAASICNLSSVKIFACNSRHLWIAPQLFIWLFGFIAILHEKNWHFLHVSLHGNNSFSDLSSVLWANSDCLKLFWSFRGKLRFQMNDICLLSYWQINHTFVKCNYRNYSALASTSQCNTNINTHLF